MGTWDGDWVALRWNFDSIVNFYGDGKPALLEGGYGAVAELSTGASFGVQIELKSVSGKSIGKAVAHGDEFGNAQMYEFDGDWQTRLDIRNSRWWRGG